jgi:hypothetical protein
LCVVIVLFGVEFCGCQCFYVVEYFFPSVDCCIYNNNTFLAFMLFLIIYIPRKKRAYNLKPKTAVTAIVAERTKNPKADKSVSQ